MHGAKSLPDDGVVLVASVENGRMKLPWDLDLASSAVDAFDGPGGYGEAIRAAERAEHRPDGAAEALGAYKRAIAAATSPAQAALAHLELSRALEAVGRINDAAVERHFGWLGIDVLEVRNPSRMPEAPLPAMAGFQTFGRGRISAFANTSGEARLLTTAKGLAKMCLPGECRAHEERGALQ